VLFVWDAKAPSARRKTFYAKLSGYGGYKGVLRGVPGRDFEWVSGSALLVAEEHAPELRRLLREYGDVVRWREFVVLARGGL
jgi:hypothetical protein